MPARGVVAGAGERELDEPRVAVRAAADRERRMRDPARDGEPLEALERLARGRLLASGPATTTIAGADVLGNSARTWPSVARAGSLCEPRATRRSACRRAAEAPGRQARRAGRPRATQERSGPPQHAIDHGRPEARVGGLRLAGAAGTGSGRGRSARRAARARAGRTVTEPATAQAMTAIVPLAIPLKTSEPIRNMPAIAIATVVPETRTVRPEVRAVRSSASCDGRPRWRSSRERIT